MSRLVHEVSTAVEGPDGTVYTARVRGEEQPTGHWEGWIEFLPRAGGPALQTRRETTQSHYQHLEYWATGLSSAYLEMALRRAIRTASPEPPPPPVLVPPAFDPDRIHEAHPDSSVLRLEIETLDPELPRRLMVAQQLGRGRVRRIQGGGILVYDGVTASEGQPSRHAFLLQYGSENAAAVLANHLWSALHGEGVTLWIEGAPVAIENHLLHDALVHRLSAAHR